MTLMTLLQRANCAAIIGIAGGAVAQNMFLWGGEPALVLWNRELIGLLPEFLVFSLAAMAGATIAGFALADTFGRNGLSGACCAFVMWPVTTAFGSCIGGMLIYVARCPDGVDILAIGAPLGWAFVSASIATSPQVAIVWVISGLAVHFAARIERTRVI